MYNQTKNYFIEFFIREFWDTPTSVFHPFEDVDMYLLDGVISFMISEFQTDSNTQY